METSKLAFSVVSNGRRPEKTTEPELTVATTKGKLKFNSALTRLMGLEHGDHAALINNSAAIAQAVADGVEGAEEASVVWGVVKGVDVMDADGNIKQSKNRVTGELEDKKTGFKLASVGKITGVGVSLEGSDSANYPELGGNADNSVAYSIDVEAHVVIIDGVETNAYILGEPRDVEKMRKA